jgi:hypothetical protein
VVKMPTLTVVEKASQVGTQSGGTERVCRECNLETCGGKGDRSPSKTPTGSDTPAEAATMNGVASTTQEMISIRIRKSGRKSR